MAGRFLIIMPTNYIARGFFLDTTPHKDKMNLFRVVMPLYHPWEHFSFDHSTVLPGEHAGLFHIDKNDYVGSAAIVFHSIAPSIDPLRQLRGPGEFLSHISWMSGNRMLGVRMDFGLTHYLLGNIREALDIFRRMDIDLNEYKQPTQDHCRPVIRRILDLLQNNPSALRVVLDAWRDDKIERLGLTASVAAPAIRLVR
jgi:hypothetical protein